MKMKGLLSVLTLSLLLNLLQIYLYFITWNRHICIAVIHMPTLVNISHLSSLFSYYLATLEWDFHFVF